MTDTTIISFITAFVVPLITQVLKRRFDLEGSSAYWVHVIVSFALAVVVVLATGRFDAANIFASLAVIIATAQTIYQGFRPKAP